jgi:DNA replication initiation complex subunit (GINS family)
VIDFNSLRLFEQQAQAIKCLEERIEKLEKAGEVQNPETVDSAMQAITAQVRKTYKKRNG